MRCSWRTLVAPWRDANMLRSVLSALLLGVVFASPGVSEAIDLEALRAEGAAGDADALFRLGAAYQNGEGVELDFGLAAQHFRLAAERGHPGAQYNLALLMLGALGVEPDAAGAYRWLSLATTGNGDVGLLAAALRERVALELGQDAAAQAEAQVAAFQPVKGPAELPVPTMPPVQSASAQKLVATLTEALRLTGCGAPRVADTDTGTEITGLIPVGTDRAALDGAAAALRAQPPIALELIELEPILCEVIALIEDARPRLEKLDGLVLRDATGTEKTIFEDGDDLIMELPAQPGDRYVWVDYFVHGGGVVHMLPTQATPDNLLPAGGRLVLGDPQRAGESWQIGPPFGRDLLVMFATARPLYASGRAEYEEASDYLRFLRQRLSSAPLDDPIAVGYRIVQTVEG
jgi:Domain of unknown function (DUF4384)/Sel1 repeat